MDITEIFQIIAANGVFAVLFSCLLIYELRDSRSREKKYQDTIGQLADRLRVVNEIKEEVDKMSVVSYKATAKKSPPQKIKES